MKTWPSLLVALVPLAMGACDSPCTFSDPEIPSAATTQGAGGQGEGGQAGGEAGGAGGHAGGEAGGAGGGATPTFVAEFNGAAFELPEGLALLGDDAYVGFAPSAKVAKVDVTDGTMTDFAQGPVIPQGTGFFVGIAFSASDELYGAVAALMPGGPTPGIYKAGATGGAMTLFSSDAANMVFPNGLAFDDAGLLYVTDSSGKIFTVNVTTGAPTIWSQDPLIAPTPADQCPTNSGLNIGANGIVLTDTDVYVAVTDTARIVRIPIEAGGAAGTAVELVKDCETLNGADGMTADADGSLLVANNTLDSIARVSLDGMVETLFSGPPLGSPASLARDGSTLYITNAAFGLIQTPPDPEQPGLLAFPLR